MRVSNSTECIFLSTRPEMNSWLTRKIDKLGALQRGAAGRKQGGRTVNYWRKFEKKKNPKSNIPNFHDRSLHASFPPISYHSKVYWSFNHFLITGFSPFRYVRKEKKITYSRNNRKEKTKYKPNKVKQYQEKIIEMLFVSSHNKLLVPTRVNS